MELNEKTVRELLAELEAQSNKILADTQAKADEIVKNATNTANDIVNNAKREADEYLVKCMTEIETERQKKKAFDQKVLESKKEIFSVFSEKAERRYGKESEVIDNSMRSIQQVLETANKTIMEMDNHLNNAYINKASSMYVNIVDQLFDLMNSCRRKLASNELEETARNEVSIALSNYEVIAEICFENLAEYGVKAIYPMHNDPVNPAMHEYNEYNMTGIMNVLQNKLYPQRIDYCTVCGFAIGEVIKRKAKVVLL